MFDTQEIGMKCLSAKGFQRGFGLAGKLIRFALEAAAIDRVAEERMADGREVYADLMGAPGLEPAGEEARYWRTVAAGIAFEDLPMRDRGAAAGAHRHLLAQPRVTADRLVEGAAGPRRGAQKEGEIPATQLLAAAVVGELAAERAVGALGLGHHHETARILIEPMHDARALDAADPGEAGAAMGHERVSQRAGPVAGRGVHDEPRRLVDDDEPGVLDHHLHCNPPPLHFAVPPP